MNDLSYGLRMWAQKSFFRFVTNHAFDKQADGGPADSIPMAIGLPYVALHAVARSKKLPASLRLYALDSLPLDPVGSRPHTHINSPILAIPPNLKRLRKTIAQEKHHAIVSTPTLKGAQKRK